VAFLLILSLFLPMISQQDFQKLKFNTLKHFWGYDGFQGFSGRNYRFCYQ
jgi:ATP-dependent DNA helicase RecQ